jgi:hypothetical protein
MTCPASARTLPDGRQPPVWSDRLYVRLPRPEIAYFKFILESYENLTLLSVVDRYEAIVQLRFSPDQRREILSVLKDLEDDLELTVLDLPLPW